MKGSPRPVVGMWFWLQSALAPRGAMSLSPTKLYVAGQGAADGALGSIAPNRGHIHMPVGTITTKTNLAQPGKTKS